MSSSLSVLIVNYNGAEYIEDTILSLFGALDNKNIDVEILVLDNNSVDGSIDILKALENKNGLPLKNYFSDDNMGFAKGCNYLADKATKDVILLLNNDTKTLSIDNLADLLIDGYFSKNDVIGTVNILNQDLTRQNNVFTYPTKIKLILELFLLKHFIVKMRTHVFKPNSIREDYKNTYFSGCVMFLPRELYKTFNGFDERFYFYHEECDLFMRVEASDRKVDKIYLEDKIIHFGGGGKEISEFSFVAYYVNLFRLFQYNNLMSNNTLNKLFKLSFSMRKLISKLGFRYKYSPFSTTYKAHSKRTPLEVLELHDCVLKKLNNIEEL
jgi:GT2 family glycosyltransferase